MYGQHNENMLRRRTILSFCPIEGLCFGLRLRDGGGGGGQWGVGYEGRRALCT